MKIHMFEEGAHCSHCYYRWGELWKLEWSDVANGRICFNCFLG